MQRLSSVPRRLAFQMVLLTAALLLFCKPVLLAHENQTAGSVMLELFGGWALIIAGLFWVGHSHAVERDDSNEVEDAGGPQD